MENRKRLPDSVIKSFFDGSVVFVAIDGLARTGSKNCLLIIHRGMVYIFDAGQEIPNFGENFSPTIHLPDFSFIFLYGLKVSAIFISHGHMDHVSGLAWLYDELIEDGQYPPVFASRHTAMVAQSYQMARKPSDVREMDAMVRSLFSGRPVFENQTHFDNLIEVAPGDVRQLPCGAVIEFFYAPHSIPGSLGCRLTVGGKSILYTGDINTAGHTPQEGKDTLLTLEDLGKKGVDLLLVDSTGIKREGHSACGISVVEAICKIIKNSTGRVFITCFSTHARRIREIFAFLKAYFPKRQIVVAGRSMYKHLEIADIRAGRDFMSWSRPFEGEVASDAVVFLTGSNGEEMSAMDRMLMKRELGNLLPTRRDAVVFATSTVPGNENQKTPMLKDVVNTGAKIHVSDHFFVAPELRSRTNIISSPCHVSGHGSKENIIRDVMAVRPKMVVGVHGGKARRQLLATEVRGLTKATPVPSNLEPVII